MFDVSALVNPDVMAGGAVAKQLPPPPMENMLRFESIMNGGGDAITDLTGGLNASMRDTPILQVQPQESDASSTGSAVIKQVTSMDQAYQRMLGQFTNMPTFSEFVSQEPAQAAAGMRSYPEVNAGTGGKDVGNQLKKMFDAEYQRTTTVMEYQGQLSHWLTNSQMLMSKIRIISAAVGQAADGFKTLFRAGGQ
ncbi:MAG: hypothetical protein JG718_11660 [Candidatus Thiothrix moscowensis]|nr:hypothetical protein [Candidatus Thiothrix moscowensis]